MRTPIIIGNWKMNKTRDEAKAFMEVVEDYLTGDEKAVYGVAAPFTALHKCVKFARHMVVAAQNVHYAPNGAYTGEVSIPMLSDLDVNWCIIGHSERRGMFNETDETINLKLKELFKTGFTPILCIGETEEQFERGETAEILKKQLSADLKDLSSEDIAKMVIAYEPIWAIGTGKSANREIAQNCCHLVRETVKEIAGEEAAEQLRIQYGGSVKPDNIKEYLAEEDIDGALIGGASLKTDSFKAIIDATR